MDPATTNIYTLSLHDALPILCLIFKLAPSVCRMTFPILASLLVRLERSCGIRSADRKSGSAGMPRPISYAVFCLKKKTQFLLDRDSFRKRNKVDDASLAQLRQ